MDRRGDMSLRVEPIGRDRARAVAFIAELHRHNAVPAGWLFGTTAWDGDQLVGVGCAGRPCRALQDGYTVELTRITSDGTRNVCSLLMGRLCRAATALGYRLAVTYTLVGEDGASLRAAGFTKVARTADQRWDRPSRRRNSPSPEGPKDRWERRL